MLHPPYAPGGQGYCILRPDLQRNPKLYLMGIAMLIEAFGPKIEEALRIYGNEHDLTALEVARIVLEDWAHAKGLIAVEQMDGPPPEPARPSIADLKDYEATMIVFRKDSRTKIAFESVAAAIEWAKDGLNDAVNAQLYVHDQQESVITAEELREASRT